MTHPVVHRIVQGQTLDLEFLLVSESLAGVSAEVRADPGVDISAITVTIEQPDTIFVRATNTTTFLIGTHLMRLWVTWPDAALEPVVEMELSVVEDTEEPAP